MSLETLTDEEVLVWIEHVNHEPARNALRELLAFRAAVEAKPIEQLSDRSWALLLRIGSDVEPPLTTQFLGSAAKNELWILTKLGLVEPSKGQESPLTLTAKGDDALERMRARK